MSEAQLISRGEVRVYDERVIDAAQTRAARAMLAWSQRDLKDRANVPLSAIKSLEAGGDVRVSVATAVERAFVEAGLVFLEPGDVRDGGRGLRFRHGSRS